jgi:predicted nucleic acid-binding protein
MKYLLDVNVLLAWGWSDHTEHRRAAKWISEIKSKRGSLLVTSAIPELGFIRVSVQRSANLLAVSEASKTLAGMLNSLGKHHRFLADDYSSTMPWPSWCATAALSTDAHLFALAESHSLQLATLDQGIPNAFLLPF